MGRGLWVFPYRSGSQYHSELKARMRDSEKIAPLPRGGQKHSNIAVSSRLVTGLMCAIGLSLLLNNLTTRYLSVANIYICFVLLGTITFLSPTHRFAFSSSLRCISIFFFLGCGVIASSLNAISVWLHVATFLQLAAAILAGYLIRGQSYDTKQVRQAARLFFWVTLIVASGSVLGDRGAQVLGHRSIVILGINILFIFGYVDVSNERTSRKSGVGRVITGFLVLALASYTGSATALITSGFVCLAVMWRYFGWFASTVILGWATSVALLTAAELNYISLVRLQDNITGVLDFLDGAEPEVGKSGFERMFIADLAISLVKQYPFFGVGLDNFRFHWDRLFSYANAGSGGTHAHNLFLEIAVGLGIPAFVLTSFIVSRRLWQSIVVWFLRGDPVLFLSSAVILITSLTNTTYKAPVFMVVLSYCLSRSGCTR